MDRHGHVPASLDVGLWRVGPAPLLYQTYTRATWILIALTVGLGSIIATVDHGSAPAALVVALAVLAAAALVFTVAQAGLLWIAGTRRHHRGDTGPVWLSRAVSCMLLALAGFVTYQNSIPSLTELWHIAHGDAELRRGEMSVSPDGTTLLFARTFSKGTADEFGALLASAPGVTMVHFQSGGGRLGEAYAIYGIIRTRNLTTIASDACYSACTLAYLGGRRRLLVDGASLGFHGPIFPGLPQTDVVASMRSMRAFLIQAGVAESFAERAVNTPPDDLWRPSNEELLAAGVVHQIIARQRQ
ncbi:MAG TPA: hypothetical protein VJR58_31090 [Vineibacter sp.]|nr:hypothetical protein [Vineibacter sp.]